VKDKVVTITMYANFNNDTDYYFAYGDVEPIKFHTAKNDIKYATSLKLVEATAYYVGQETSIAYKFYNADGVELNITDLPSLEVVSDYAYGIGTKIYFHTAGEATIKASIVTGYDDETNKAIVLTDSLTVKGVEKTASQTGKIYSFDGTATHEKHQIRITNSAGAQVLAIRYTLSDDSTVTINSNDPGYSIKSTDETVAMIAAGNTVYGVNKGSATIVLYKGEDVVDAFPITVLDENKVGSATATLSKETLNTAAGVTDEITLTVVGLDLDGEKDNRYTATVQQLENNDIATGIKWNNRASANIITTTDGGKTNTITLKGGIVDNRADKTQFATVRLVVTVKDTTAATNTVLTKTVSFVVSQQASSTSSTYKVSADKTSLDTSLKNWKDADLTASKATVKVTEVKATSYGDFFIAEKPFALITSVNDIPVTAAAAGDYNFVIYSAPKTYANLVVGSFVPEGTINDATAFDNDNVQIVAFPAASSRADAGTYTFTGYHVSFADPVAPATESKGVRTSLGSANVVVSKSDVVATAAVTNGTASNFANKVGSPADIFTVTWDGLKTSDTPTPRVTIGALTQDVNYTFDTATNSYYCKYITATLKIDDGSHTQHTFTQDITINKLFKDE